jgi:hypothetical protein
MVEEKMSTEITALLWQQGPLVILLGLILLAGYKRVWVWGYQLTTTEERCSKLEAIVFRQLNISDKAVGTLEQTTRQTSRRRAIPLDGGEDQ